MLDIQLLRNDPAAIAARLKTRGYVLDVARFESTEARRKSVQTRTQELQARRNAVSKAIGSAKGRGEDATALMSEVAGLGEELKALETELDDIQSDLREWLLAMPNLPHASVPVGTSEAQNVELRRVGTPPAFAFEAHDHVDVGAAVGGLEFEQSAKLSGSRFYTLRGNVARLHRALSQWMLDLHSAEHGYVECYMPYVVNRAAMIGTGQLPKFEDDLFWVTKGGAAEVRIDATSTQGRGQTVGDLESPERRHDCAIIGHQVKRKMAQSPCRRASRLANK
jgi:seryl-tRNA synthetase